MTTAQILSQLAHAADEHDIDRVRQLVNALKSTDPSSIYLRAYTQWLARHQQSTGSTDTTSTTAAPTKSVSSIFSSWTIGQTVVRDDKTLIIAGAVRYKGHRYEGSTSGKLVYNERLVYDDQGEQYFVAESSAAWYEGGESGTEYEATFSTKVSPDFVIQSRDDRAVTIDDTQYPLTERDTVAVQRVAGDHAKGYAVGETIVLYEFVYQGQTYVLECEGQQGSQEVGIYLSRQFPRSLMQGNRATGVTTTRSSKPMSLMSRLIRGAMASIVIRFFVSPATDSVLLIGLPDEVPDGTYRVEMPSRVDRPTETRASVRHDYGGTTYSTTTIDQWLFRVESDADREIIAALTAGGMTQGSLSPYVSSTHNDIATLLTDTLTQGYISSLSGSFLRSRYTAGDLPPSLSSLAAASSE